MKETSEFLDEAVCAQCGAERLGAFCWRCGAAAADIGDPPGEPSVLAPQDVVPPQRHAAIDTSSRPDTAAIVMPVAAFVAAIAALAIPWLAMVLGFGGFVALALTRRSGLPRDPAGGEAQSA